jgi:hypothetical protein
MTHDQGVSNPLNRPSFTLREAADRCGASLSTIRRKHSAGAFPSTYKGPDGAWRVTVEDLLAVGLTPTSPPKVSDPDQPHEQPRGTFMSVPVEQWVSMRERAIKAEAEAAGLLAQLDERGKALEDLRRLAFRELEAPKPTNPGRVDESPATIPAGPRRRWWKRAG